MFPSSRRLQLDVEQTTEIYCVIMTFSSDTILDFTTYTNKSDLQQKNASLFIKVIFSEIKKATCTVTHHTMNVKNKASDTSVIVKNVFL